MTKREAIRTLEAWRSEAADLFGKYHHKLHRGSLENCPYEMELAMTRFMRMTAMLIALEGKT